MTSSDDILDLVRDALHEFDGRPLEVSVRRAVRIATLLGESRIAVRLGLELKPTGGHPPANAEDTRRLMADASSWGDPNGPAEQALGEYMSDRQRDDGKILGHSISEMNFLEREYEDLGTLSDSQHSELFKDRILVHQILERTRHRTFVTLVSWERQLAFSSINERIFARFQDRVDGLLAAEAPHLLDKFNSIYKRLRDEASGDPGMKAGEELSQAVTTCRRILKAVVDLVYPPKDESESHKLDDEHYRNRLREFTKGVAESHRLQGVLSTEIGGIYERFAAVDGLANKGVHADLAFEEAELCAISTYIVAGEILLLDSDNLRLKSTKK